MSSSNEEPRTRNELHWPFGESGKALGSRRGPKAGRASGKACGSAGRRWNLGPLNFGNAFEGGQFWVLIGFKEEVTENDYFNFCFVFLGATADFSAKNGKKKFLGREMHFLRSFLSFYGIIKKD